MTLRQAAAHRGLWIGAATNVQGVTGYSEPQYRPLEQAQFSLTTAENACKVGPIHPERGRYNWAGCDAIFAAAQAGDEDWLALMTAIERADDPARVVLGKMLRWALASDAAPAPATSGGCSCGSGGCDDHR